MRVGPANAKGAHTCPMGQATAWPFSQRRVHVKGAVFKVDLRIGSPKVQTGRDQPMLEREDRLDKTGHTGSRVEMANIGLDRADSTKAFLFSAGAKDLRQG